MSDVMNFVDSLPTRKVGGVGKVLEKMLHSFNLMTMKDVRENMEAVLFSFTPASADFLLHTTLGIAINEGRIRKDIIKLGDVSEDIGRKSLGAERTFSLCCELYSDQKNKLKELCQKVSNELKEKKLWGKTVTLKVKTIKFELFTRSLTNKNYFQNSDVIEKIAYQLLETVIPIKIRLIGVTISKFITKKGTIQFPATSTCLLTSSSSSSSSTTSSSLIRNYFTSTEEKVIGIQNKDIKCRKSVNDNEKNKKDDDHDDDDIDDNNGYGDGNDVHMYNSEAHALDDNHDCIDCDDCDNERVGDHYDDYCYDEYDNNYNEHSNNDNDSNYNNNNNNDIDNDNNNNNNNNNDSSSNSNNSSSRLNDDNGDSKYEELHNHDIEVEMVRDKDRDRDSVDVTQWILSPTTSSPSNSTSAAPNYSSSIPHSNDIVSSLPFAPSSSTSFSSSASSFPLPSSPLIFSSSSSSSTLR